MAICLLGIAPHAAAQLRAVPESGAAYGRAPAAVYLLPSAAAEASPGKMIAGGLIGGAGGALGGMMIGLAVTNDLSGYAVGYLAGSSLGIPLGVHEGGGRRGRLLPSLAASLAIGAVGSWAVNEARGDTKAMIAFGAMPALQILSSLWIETATR